MIRFLLALAPLALLGCGTSADQAEGGSTAASDAGMAEGATPQTDAAIAPDDASADADASGCASLVPPLPATSGPSIHVAGNGDDTAGDGSAAKPFATLGHALKNATPGTRVYLGGGSFCHGTSGSFDATYCPTQFATYTVNGTAAEPIVVTAEPGEHPVFDFSLLTNAAYGTEAAMTFKASHLVVDSIEVKNSPNAGITFGPAASFCTLSRSKLHDLQFQAVEVLGTDFVVAGNQMYNLVLENTNGTPQAGYWPSCNMSWFASGNTSNASGWSARVQWLENDVHDCWGEGINALFVDTVDIIGNRIADTYSHKIYVDHGRNVRILRNSIYQANVATYGVNKGPNAGVAIDDELYGYAAYMHEDDILIANNYFGPNLFRTLFRYDRNTGSVANSNIDNTWSNVHFVFNVVEPSLFAFAKVIGDGNGVTAPSGGVIAGNVFLGQPTFQLGDPAAWTVAHNSFPAPLSNSSFGGNLPTLDANFQATPTFVGPTDGSSLAGFVLTNPASFDVPYDPALLQMPSSMPNYSVPTFLDHESLALSDYACRARGATTAAGLWQP